MNKASNHQYANEPKVPYGDTFTGSVSLGSWAGEMGELSVSAVPVTTADERISIENIEHFQFDIFWMSKDPAIDLEDPEQMSFSTLQDLVDFRDRLNEAIDHIRQYPQIGDGPAIDQATTP